MPGHFPKADGAAAPGPDSTEHHDRIKLEFVAAYYRLNSAWARLSQVRRGRKTGTQTTSRSSRRIQTELKQALRARDELADRYAPYGVIAEPAVKRGVVVDVKFSFGDLQSRKQAAMTEIVTSAYVSIPLPAGWEATMRKAVAGQGQ